MGMQREKIRPITLTVTHYRDVIATARRVARRLGCSATQALAELARHAARSDRFKKR